MNYLSKRVLAVVGLGAVIAAGAVTANAVVTSPMPSDYNAVAAVRVLDTRTTVGGHDAPVSAGTTLTLTLPTADVPAGASAVTLDVTATSPTASGYLSTASGTSDLNYTRGETVANQITVPVTNGTVGITVGGSGTTELIVDVEGYYTAAPAAYTAPTAVTASLNVPAAGEAITTGGSFSKNATSIGTLTFPVAGTYQIDTSFVATPDENTSGNVFPQLLFLDNFNVGGAAIENANGELTGTPQNPMSLDYINSSISGTDTITVTAGEVVNIDAFGYDSDTGAGSYWLTNPQVTAIPITTAS